VLVLAMLAALCTPLLAQAIRHSGWGLLRQPAAMAVAGEPAIVDPTPILGERKIALPLV
jgi:hypothetical protein